ncbi:hypothetical protein GCM10022254_37550 [Actinomadura meridiana]|uniref:Uncharacterized protein n=1 Tax=Actinomadura meridiana TaxID=559626 RepID=A0ABP8C629_9ACTN
MERRVIVRNVTASPLASPPPGSRPTRPMIAQDRLRGNAAGPAFVLLHVGGVVVAAFAGGEGL